MKKIVRMVKPTAVLILVALLVSTSALFAQTRNVTGTVKDSGNNEALPGVTVVEKGTSNGTVTDGDGRFTISVSEGATLQFTFIGMAPKEVAVGNQTTFEVLMDADVQQLDEVVVVGYGTVKKSDLTGSVASIGGDDLRKVPVATVAESLTGRLAGVQVTTTEGSPDAEINIRVRGGGSITQDNAPLYIVDGFPVATISDISTSDIKTIDVLKDASSTAIYGSRGANGVVIITTKGGTAGKLSVSFNSFYGIRKIAKTLDVLEPSDYVNWQYEYTVLRRGIDNLDSYEDYFGAYQDRDLYSGLRGNDWQRQVYGRTGYTFSNDLSVRGGSDKLTYSINLANFNEKAIQIGSDYNRNNITVRVNNKPNDKIDIGFTLRYSETQINGGGANEQNEASSADSRLKHVVTYSPIPIAGISTGDTDPDIANNLINPIIATDDNQRYQERQNYNMGTTFGWNIIENLQWRSDFGLENYFYDDSRFYGLTTYYVSNTPAAENQDQPAMIVRDRRQARYRNTNTLSYDFKKYLGADHSARFMIGEEMLKTVTSEKTSVIHGFPTLFTFEEAFKLTSQGKPQSVNNFYQPDDNLLSFFGRLMYEYKGKYLLTATYRADGSSKFLADNRWGYFPSAALAWKVSEESFMTGTSNWLDNLKARLSFGTAGNNNIPGGQTSQAFVSSNTAWINGFDSYWAPFSTLANPDLKWETTTTRNVGVDFGLLKGRVTGTLDVYLNNTKDLLIPFPIPGSGYVDQFRNIGETQNKGFEAAINYIAIDKADYGLNFSFNISMNRGKVVSLGGLNEMLQSSTWAGTAVPNDFLVRPGLPVGMMYGYQHAGRYEVSDFEGYDNATNNWILKAGVPDGSAVVGDNVPGMLKLVDRNGDGKITIDDQTIIGNANPKAIGGFVLNGYAYGFDLTAAFNYSFGNDIYNANKIEYTTAPQNVQYRNFISMMGEGERWTNIDPASGLPITDPAALAALNANTTMWSPYMDRPIFSDWAVEDGSFVRLNTLTLGYTVPNSITSKAKISSLRFYLTGYNVFVITNYSGFDPEVSTRRKTALTPGVDYSAYPRSRQLVFGLNLNF